MQKIKDIFEEFWNKITNVYYSINYFITFVISLPSWIKLAWQNNYDYDYYTALNLFIWKIKRIRDHIAKHNYHVDWEKDVAKINEFLDLINQGNAFAAEDLEEMKELLHSHYEKWGERKMNFVDFGSGDGTSIVKFVNSKATTEEENNQANDEHYALLQKEYEIRHARWLKAFDILRDNIQDWWC